MSETVRCLKCRGFFVSNRDHVCAVGGNCQDGKHVGFCHGCLKKEIEGAFKGFEKQFQKEVPKDNAIPVERQLPQETLKEQVTPDFNRPRFIGPGNESAV